MLIYYFITMEEKIPFVISEAHPDWKRPFVLNQFGTCNKSDIPSYFIDKVAEFILDRSDPGELFDLEKIQIFWREYYSEYYMDNPPWEATIFIDGTWVNITPTDEETLEGIKKIILAEKNYIQQEEKIDENMDDEDAIIIEKMREYFLKENLTLTGDVTSENYIGQLVQVLNKHMLNSNIEKFNENRELLRNFVNVLTKNIEKDIETVTSDLEIIHSQENVDMLQYLLRIYGNLLEYKNYFKF